MAKSRIPEISMGIRGDVVVSAYDQMQRKLRDRGWIETGLMLKRGINRGCALEIGPGPGYLGLEWLKHTQGTTLKGLELSPDMIAIAERNAREYGLSQRAEYVHGDGEKMPFGDHSFDAVFTNGSMHEWANPRDIFNEIRRVLKPDGRVFISDLRRDMAAPVKWFLWMCTSPKWMRPGLLSSINSAYTPEELTRLIAGTGLENCRVEGNSLGVMLVGMS
jgi:ubiquinone/menaquinone biosynthesis C-methylase UbiE